MAANAKDKIIGFFPRFFVDGMTMYSKDLANKGEVEILVQFIGNPDWTRFKATMIQRTGLLIVGFFAVFKKEFNRLKQRRLIIFDGDT